MVLAKPVARPWVSWELESAKPWQGEAMGDLRAGIGQTLSAMWC